MGEIVLYLPVGGCPSTADIARGSTIVGEPGTGAEVEVHFEGAIHGQGNMRTLADRAAHAAGRMLEGYTTSASRIVPRDALVAVGTFDFGEGRITLTGPDSERAVAAWLGTLRLDQAELGPGGATCPDSGGQRKSDPMARLESADDPPIDGATNP